MKKRALEILRYKKTDRLPAVHFGYWAELLTEWAEQGHISKELAAGTWDGSEKEKELDKILGWDHNWAVTVGGNMNLMPPFEHKVLEKLPDGFLRVQNVEGLIERIREGANGIPAEDDYLLKDRNAYETLFKPKFQYSDQRINLEHIKSITIADKEYPVGVFAGSVLGSIRSMLSVVGMSYMICDDYGLLREIVDTFADMQYNVVKKILETGIKFDFAHYWEDICFKNGPLVSPAMFEDLCAKHYKKRNELLHSYGIDIISLDCDGVIDKLVPIWFETGVNTMFPIEVGVWGDQFAPARKKFGKGLLGIGGMDKTVLRKDRAAVDEEIKRLIPLIKLGGYLPCPDHRLMPGTKFDLVKYYAERIKNLKVFN